MRLLMVYAERDGRRIASTAVPIAPDLAIAALHSVAAADGAPTDSIIARSFDGAYRNARLVWSEPQLDAALLSLEPALPSEFFTPVRFGRFATDVAQECRVVGVPRIANTGAGGRDSRQVEGSIRPGSRQVSGRYEISLSPEDVAAIGDHPDGWRGISGAGVFVNELLVGIVSEATRESLIAVRVEHLLDEESFRTALRGATRPAINAEAQPVELDHLVPRTAFPRSPASLLRPDAATLRFRPGNEFQVLRSWCVDEGDDKLFRLVWGGAGCGKTRLARELVDHVRARGWEAVFVPSIKDSARLSVLAAVTRPLLIVFDYAEARHAQMDEVAFHLRRRHRARTRILLLARTDQRTLVRGLLRGMSEIPQSPTIMLGNRVGLVDGSSVWIDSLHSLAAGLSRIDAYSDRDWTAVATHVAQQPSTVRRDSSDAGEPPTFLEIEMHALLALLDAAEPGTDRVTQWSTDLTLEAVLKHEEFYWSSVWQAHRAAAGRATALSADDQRLAVTLASTWSASDRHEGRNILGAGLDWDDPAGVQVGEVAEWIAGIYGDPGPEGMYWNRVEPDLLTEHMVADLLSPNRRPAIMRTSAEAASPNQMLHSIEVLVNASQAHPHVFEALIHLVRSNPRFAGAAARSFPGLHGVERRQLGEALTRVDLDEVRVSDYLDFARAFELIASEGVGDRADDAAYPGHVRRTCAVNAVVLSEAVIESRRAGAVTEVDLLVAHTLMIRSAWTDATIAFHEDSSPYAARILRMAVRRAEWIAEHDDAGAVLLADLQSFIASCEVNRHRITRWRLAKRRASRQIDRLIGIDPELDRHLRGLLESAQNGTLPSSALESPQLIRAIAAPSRGSLADADGRRHLRRRSSLTRRDPDEE